MTRFVAVVRVTSVVLGLGLLGCDGGGGYDMAPPPGSGAVDAATGDNGARDASGARDADTASDAGGSDAGGSDAQPDAAPAGADLAIAITAAPAPVDLSSTLTYTIDITNLGPEEASDVRMTQRLPPGNVAFESATGIDWTCAHDGQEVTCERGALHVGAAPSIAVKVTTPPSSGTLSTAVHVEARSDDPIATNNDAMSSTMVLTPDLATADLSVAIADTPDPVQGSGMGCPAGCTTYTINVSNAGPNLATEVRVAIVLPGQGNFFEIVGTGWVCPAPQIREVFCTRPSLAVGSAPVISLTWRAPSPGGFSIEVSSTVSGSSTDLNPMNDTANEDTTVRP